MGPRSILVVGVVALGCTAPERRPGAAPPEDGTTSGPTDSSPTPTGSDTSPPTDTGTTVPSTLTDCANLPPAPLARVELGMPRGYHGLAFDTDGFVIGSDERNLVKADAYGSFAVHATGTGDWIQQMDWLPDGDLVIADDEVDSVYRIHANGAKTLIASDLGFLYGLRVGPDGLIYTANQDVVQRTDPTTGVTEVVVDPKGAFRPKVLDWSPDYPKMYVGTFTGTGEIYVLDVDVATMDPITPPTPFATGTGGYHDCLDVDECGNLWVCDFTDRTLWRVTPAGQPALVVQWSLTDYGHGLEWGTGADGWPDTSIYLPQPYDGNTVVQLDIGVRSRYTVAPPWP